MKNSAKTIATNGTSTNNASAIAPKKQRERVKRSKRNRSRRKKQLVDHFDKKIVTSFMTDMEKAINGVAQKYGTKPVEMGDIKFKEDVIKVKSLNVKLPDFISVHKELNIIDANYNRRKRRARVVVTHPEPVDFSNSKDVIGKEFKQNHKTFTVLEEKDGKFLAITRRHKKYLLSKEQLQEMAIA